MINITMELCNKPPLSKEAIIVYWQILNKYEFSTVRAALDKWVDSSSKAPTPHDLKDLCKPVTPIYNAIAKKVDKAANKQYADNVVKFVQQHNNGASRDWIKYWEDILREPKGHKEITLKSARDALKQLGKAWQVQVYQTSNTD